MKDTHRASKERSLLAHDVDLYFNGDQILSSFVLMLIRLSNLMPPWAKFKGICKPVGLIDINTKE